MFWSGSGAFIRRHADTGDDAQYFNWQISFSSRRDTSGSRWLDVLHLSCSRHSLGVSHAQPTGEVEIRLAVRDGAGEDGATGRLLRLRVSAQAIDLWIAAAGPAARSKPHSRHRAVSTLHARPAIEAGIPDGTILLDGGTIVLDGPIDAYRA